MNESKIISLPKKALRIELEFVNLQGDADSAARNGADGIGLYRLEGLYFEHGSLPSEDELVAEIVANLAPFSGRPSCLRLLDIGGDKQLPFLTLPAEPNPFLGRRGIRLPKLLRAGVRMLSVAPPLIPIIKETVRNTSA